MTESGDNRQKSFYTAGVVIAIILVATAAAIFFFSYMTQSGSSGPDNTYCRIGQNGMLLDPCVPLFRIVNGTNDTVNYRNFSVRSHSLDNPVPSTEDVPGYAEKALCPYGGMPKDAVIVSVRDTSWWGIDSTNGTIDSGVGSRMAEYRQSPYGMPLYGSAGILTVELGGLGKISSIEKRWLSLEETGLIKVMPASAALERLKARDGKNIPDGLLNLTVHDIKTGYYTSDATSRSFIEPVWIFNATDEIRGTTLLLFVPATTVPEQQDLYHGDPGGTKPTFTQIGGAIPQPDIRTASNILIGTNGPVGEERARESIRSFTENPDFNGTCNGRFIEQNRCGMAFHRNYYSFTTPDCEFKVDTYTGNILSASMGQSCSKAGIRNLTQIMTATPEQADMAVTNLTRNRYYGPDRDTMTITYRSDTPKDPDIIYIFEGTSELIDVRFDRDSGLLKYYAAYDKNKMTQCGGDPVRIGY